MTGLRHLVTVGSVIAVTDDRLTELGRRLRALREWRGLSQERLAERVELHRPYVTGIESGTVDLRVSKLLDLAAALDVPVCDLFADPFVMPRRDRG
jgi:transcriptional regulator with XRE-family HTH domain